MDPGYQAYYNGAWRQGHPPAIPIGRGNQQQFSPMPYAEWQALMGGGGGGFPQPIGTGAAPPPVTPPVVQGPDAFGVTLPPIAAPTPGNGGGMNLGTLNGLLDPGSLYLPQGRGRA
jgi:hypothetical protein